MINYDGALGEHKRCYLSYANDESVRSGAASGGVVTQILLYCLEEKIINQAIVSRISCEGDEIEAKVLCTNKREDILSARTSIYFDFDLLSEVIRNINSSEDKFGIVMLPCQIKAFKTYCDNKNINRERFIIIGLFCGHATDKKLLSLYFEKKGIPEEKIIQFKFRTGHWRGKSSVKTKDSDTVYYPYFDYGILQNLYLYCKIRCLSCQDHFAVLADISCGDAWIRKMKSNPIKHSIMLSRNDRSDKIIKEMVDKKLITANEKESLVVARAQKRSIIYHDYNISGRKALSKLFNIPVSFNREKKPRWNDLIGAFFIMFNVKISDTKFGRYIIMKVPKPLLFAYAIFIKVFLNF
jgi:coenzyme F420 hydrogenase subunit beta